MNLEEKRKFIINFTYFVIYGAIIFVCLKFLSSYLLPFVIGIIIAYFVQKPAAFLSCKMRIKKQNCAAFLSVSVFIILIAFIVILALLLYRQLNDFLNYFSNHSDEIKSYFKSFYSRFENVIKRVDIDSKIIMKIFSDNALNGLISSVSSFLSKNVTSFIKKLPILLITCVVTVVSTFYIAKDYAKLVKFLRGFIVQDIYDRITLIKNIVSECFLKFFVGYFWLFLITWSQLFIGFIVLGVRHFILLSFFVAFLDILPVIGTGTILIPWAIVMIIMNNYLFAAGLIILYVIIAVARNFLEPRIIGKQIGINPLFTLLFIFLGMRIGGVFGMIILPVVVTVIYTYYRKQIIN